ncbi:MAG: hypothetical protein OXF02_03575 [Simkaniaceae bacterium]|nr:hypothetical protein [Simkaniaceae bacterium]
METDTPAVDCPLIPAPVVPPTVPVTKEEGVNQSEEEKQVLSAMTARFDASKGTLVVQLPPECGSIPDEIVRDEEPADEVIGESEDDRVDALIEGLLKHNEVKAFKDVVRQFARENLN